MHFEIKQFKASPNLIILLIACSFILGYVPGCPIQTGQILMFGVFSLGSFKQEQNILLFCLGIGTTEGGFIQDDTGVKKDENGNSNCILINILYFFYIMR